ncbi:MAG TPA: HAMP domain-containing sensor histidine kinase [Terriglobales bacterium]|nr:HAMP domain-containing sensor histidine kinase [Terriglobales bacterium]
MTSAVKKERPMEISKQNFQEMENFACLGEVLGGVAHEINNPLQIILGKAQILRMKMSEPQNYQKSLDDLAAIEKGAQRISELVSCLNDLSCQSAPGNSFKTDVDLNYLLNSILPLINACLKDKKIEANLNLSEKLPKVKGNSLELKKLFMFLTLNAKKRICRGGKLRVNFQKEGDYLKVAFDGPGEGSVGNTNTSSETTNSGRSEKEQDFGFLSSSQIVQEHKGELEIIENPEKGDTLIVKLPLI